MSVCRRWWSCMRRCGGRGDFAMEAPEAFRRFAERAPTPDRPEESTGKLKLAEPARPLRQMFAVSHQVLCGTIKKGSSTDRPIGEGPYPMKIERITHNPAVMGGKPCIRGLRVTVGTILGLLASGHSRERILQAYPYLEPEDIDAVLSYAAWRMQEREEALVVT